MQQPWPFLLLQAPTQRVYIFVNAYLLHGVVAFIMPILTLKTNTSKISPKNLEASNEWHDSLTFVIAAVSVVLP